MKFIIFYIKVPSNLGDPTLTNLPVTLFFRCLLVFFCILSIYVYEYIEIKVKIVSLFIYLSFSAKTNVKVK